MNSVMHKITALLWLALFLLFATFVFSKQLHAADQSWVKPLLNKEKVTIAVTDSGLGGLSVVADAVQKFERHHGFKNVELIFFNALFTNKGGYNSLKTRDDKVKVFSSALQSLQDNYAPDVILIACNTLSVIYEDTSFAHTTTTPVVGIVEDGVEQIKEKIGGNPAAKNIIFATQTTISENSHKNGLMTQGVAADQIMTQACPELTLYIEQGFDSIETELLIDAYVDEAVSQLEKTTDPLYVSFNCTHFGYSLDLWKQAFDARDIAVAGFLNPNTKMINFLLHDENQDRFTSTDIKVQVISMTDIPADRQASIGRYLQGISPLTAKALATFEQKPNLFEWRNLVSH